MSYICENCGCKFNKMAHWTEGRGEFWGIPCREDMYGCPNCYDTDIREIDEDVQNVKELEG